MLQSGWGPDGYIAMNCFLTMMNGKPVPAFDSTDEFEVWKQKEWAAHCRFHALFAEKPGAVVGRPEMTYLNFTDTADTIAESASGAFSEDTF